MSVNERAPTGQQAETTWLGRPAASYIDEAADGMSVFKRELLETMELRAGDRVLDIGCGTGIDVAEMALRVGSQGLVVGIDLLESVLDEARSRTAHLGSAVEFRAAAGEDLPFDNDTFDVCHTERMLQHTADPALIIAEMVRVARPGGRILLADTDHGMWALDMSDRQLTRMLLTRWFDHVRNPWMGRQLPGLLRAAGGVNVRVEVKSVVLTSLGSADKLTGISAAADDAVQDGTITADQAATWAGELAHRDFEGRFFMCGALMAVSGQKASR